MLAISCRLAAWRSSTTSQMAVTTSTPPTFPTRLTGSTACSRLRAAARLRARADRVGLVSAAEREQRPAAGNALQLVKAPFLERERAADDGAENRARDEHLAEIG